MPISVITSDDIRYSGLTNLYEIIQFAPGVEMLKIDNNRYALRVRGLHEFFSDLTLTLIDGKIADSPVFDGSELLRIPLFLDEIERIEIVRGPGGAVWGANAFNGVINNITKTPDVEIGHSVSSSINEFGDNFTEIGWTDNSDNWDWRLKLGYDTWESSSEAVKNDHFESNDFNRNI